jgi:mannan endo-1,6-alpha-mannosidase
MVWWRNGTFDKTGVGQQMSALEMTLSVLVSFDDPDPYGNGTDTGRPRSGIKPPTTGTTGGTSASNPNAGHNPDQPKDGELAYPVQQKDRVGAWFLTVVVVVTAIAAAIFLSTSLFEHGGSSPTILGMAKGHRSGKEVGEKRITESANASGVLSGESTDVVDEEPPKPRYRGGSLVT